MTALLLEPIYQQHDPGPGHPESLQRHIAITKALTESGLVAKTQPISPRAATLPELELCHTRRYIEKAREDVESGLDDLSTGDTAICAKSYDVAIHAVGGVLNAVDAVFTGKAQNAFCAVRPPGHHARPAQGMGFCLFNNIAIAARHAQKAHGAQKVAIIDWDVHHGNGTQDIFYEDGSVFFASTHQSPLYPFTGHADEKGSGKGKAARSISPFPPALASPTSAPPSPTASCPRSMPSNPTHSSFPPDSTPASTILSASSASPTTTLPN